MQDLIIIEEVVKVTSFFYFYTMETKVLTTIDEMLSHLKIIQQLYPEITFEKYQSFLVEMIPHNYQQLAVFEHDNCIGLTGFWTGIKLWSGKYIEIDNFIVHENHRRKGIGKIMTDYIANLAEQSNCNIIYSRIAGCRYEYFLTFAYQLRNRFYQCGRFTGTGRAMQYNRTFILCNS